MTLTPAPDGAVRIHRVHAAARALLVAYLVVVLIVVAWPTPVDRPIDGGLNAWLTRMHAGGLPGFVDYAVIEAGANVLMFIPLAVLLAVAFPRLRLWIVPVSCVALSVAIELAQSFWLPGRFGTVQDVVCNSIGALLGALIVFAARSSSRRRRGVS
jgi:glycopeptide antibiotics resistance protein